MSEPTYRKGQRVVAKSEVDDDRRWVCGIITDAFAAPVTGTMVYVVDGIGYYGREIHEAAGPLHTESMQSRGPLAERIAPYSGTMPPRTIEDDAEIDRVRSLAPGATRDTTRERLARIRTNTALHNRLGGA